MEDTLWHIDWGDGDTTFVIAPDKETAISRMPDGGDMINTIVRLDGLYGLIFKAGIKEVVEHVQECEKQNPSFWSHIQVEKTYWQAELKEWDK